MLCPSCRDYKIASTTTSRFQPSIRSRIVRSTQQTSMSGEFTSASATGNFRIPPCRSSRHRQRLRPSDAAEGVASGRRRVLRLKRVLRTSADSERAGERAGGRSSLASWRRPRRIRSALASRRCSVRDASRARREEPRCPTQRGTICERERGGARRDLRGTSAPAARRRQRRWTRRSGFFRALVRQVVQTPAVMHVPGSSFANKCRPSCLERQPRSARPRPARVRVSVPASAVVVGRIFFQVLLRASTLGLGARPPVHCS